MKFIMLFGPQAVGKMTVGEELAKLTNLKLFHNHMPIDLLAPLLGFTPEMWRLVNLFREEVFKAIANSISEGLIFTYVWAFDMQEDWDYVNRVCQIFESKGVSIYFVELEATLAERLERNKSAHRLERKPTKRNIRWSEKELRKTLEEHRLNSFEGEITRSNYLRIENSDLTPQEAAQIIKDKFKL
ncbi:MAG: AAA family ATPase [Sporolactobacillus sp.]